MGNKEGSGIDWKEWEFGKHTDGVDSRELVYFVGDEFERLLHGFTRKIQEDAAELVVTEMLDDFRTSSVKFAIQDMGTQPELVVELFEKITFKWELSQTHVWASDDGARQRIIAALERLIAKARIGDET